MQKTGSQTQLLGPGSRRASADGEAYSPARPSPAALPPQHRRTSSSSSTATGGGPATAGLPPTPGPRRPGSSSGVVPQRQQVEQELIYEKLPADIAERYVMLMDPILGSGNSAARAIQVGLPAWRTSHARAYLALCRVLPAGRPPAEGRSLLSVVLTVLAAQVHRGQTGVEAAIARERRLAALLNAFPPLA